MTCSKGENGKFLIVLFKELIVLYSNRQLKHKSFLYQNSYENWCGKTNLGFLKLTLQKREWFESEWTNCIKGIFLTFHLFTTLNKDNKRQLRIKTLAVDWINILLSIKLYKTITKTSGKNRLCYCYVLSRTFCARLHDNIHNYFINNMDKTKKCELKAFLTFPFPFFKYMNNASLGM